MKISEEIFPIVIHVILSAGKMCTKIIVKGYRNENHRECCNVKPGADMRQIPHVKNNFWGEFLYSTYQRRITDAAVKLEM